MATTVVSIVLQQLEGADPVLTSTVVVDGQPVSGAKVGLQLISAGPVSGSYLEKIEHSRDLLELRDQLRAALGYVEGIAWQLALEGFGRSAGAASQIAQLQEQVKGLSERLSEALAAEDEDVWGEEVTPAA